MFAQNAIVNRIVSSYQYYKNKTTNIIDTNYNLALLHLYHQNFHDAYWRLRFVLKLNNNYTNAQYYLAHCLYALNRSEEALLLYQKLLQADQEFIAAQYMTKFLEDCKIPEQLDQSLVASFCNSLIDDKNLKSLLPLHQSILSVLTTSFDHINDNLELLDVGCGIGTLFEFLKKSLKIKHSIGIDFADLVISSHHQQTLYSELHCLDWQNFSHDTKFDLVIADRVLHFQPTLSASLKQLATMIHHDGAILLTVECSNNQRPSVDFNDSLINFRYNKDHVLKEIRAANLKAVKIEECTLDNKQSFLICLCANI